MVKKHNLDLDDGGGGDPKAGRKYMDMWAEIDALDSKAQHEASRRATEHLINKYGDKPVKKLKRSDNARTAAAMASIMTIPAAAIMFVVTDSKR